MLRLSAFCAGLGCQHGGRSGALSQLVELSLGIGLFVLAVICFDKALRPGGRFLWLLCGYLLGTASILLLLPVLCGVGTIAS